MSGLSTGSKTGGSGLSQGVVVLIVVILVVIATSRCGSDDCDEVSQFRRGQQRIPAVPAQPLSGGFRTGGGSRFFSSGGGGHK
ncbi:MAG: hypothetical protein U1F53_09085 [Burkholderiaceae bacterium]